MIRVLALSKYDRMAASPRHRFIQFQPALRAQGVELELSPLFDDAYLKERFSSGRARPEHVVRAVLRRMRALVEARRWDLVIVHCELVPYLPPWFERVALAGVPYVYDYDDAIFHMYDAHSNPWVRKLLGQKVAGVIKGARAVLAGSRYLEDYARRVNANVHWMPTVIDLDRYRIRSEVRNSKLVVGWIGSPSTSAYLDEVEAPLARLAQEGPVKLLAVGAKPRTIPGVEVEVRGWREDREVDDLLECDVGIMPLTDTPWSRGKCAFKLIQYMACGLPSVASPVGANSEVVTEETGLLAADADAWVQALRTLRDDPALRARLGAAGRARVTQEFSVQGQATRMAQILTQAAQ